MPCAESPSDTTWLNLEHPTGRQADSVVPTKQVIYYPLFHGQEQTRCGALHTSCQDNTLFCVQQLQPVWQVKRRSALDRHAAFVKRLERQRLAREKSGQVRCIILALPNSQSHITLLCAQVCLPIPFTFYILLLATCAQWQSTVSRLVCFAQACTTSTQLLEQISPCAQLSAMTFGRLQLIFHCVSLV